MKPDARVCAVGLANREHGNRVSLRSRSCCEICTDGQRFGLMSLSVRVFSRWFCFTRKFSHAVLALRQNVILRRVGDKSLAVWSACRVVAMHCSADPTPDRTPDCRRETGDGRVPGSPGTVRCRRPPPFMPRNGLPVGLAKNSPVVVAFALASRLSSEPGCQGRW
jgi:hypothetical protein